MFYQEPVSQKLGVTETKITVWCGLAYSPKGQPGHHHLAELFSQRVLHKWSQAEQASDNTQCREERCSHAPGTHHTRGQADNIRSLFTTEERKSAEGKKSHKGIETVSPKGKVWQGHPRVQNAIPESPLHPKADSLLSSPCNNNKTVSVI